MQTKTYTRLNHASKTRVIDKTLIIYDLYQIIHILTSCLY